MATVPCHIFIQEECNSLKSNMSNKLLSRAARPSQTGAGSISISYNGIILHFLKAVLGWGLVAFVFLVFCNCLSKTVILEYWVQESIELCECAGFGAALNILWILIPLKERGCWRRIANISTSGKSSHPVGSRFLNLRLNSHKCSQPSHSLPSRITVTGTSNVLP